MCSASTLHYCCTCTCGNRVYVCIAYYDLICVLVQEREAEKIAEEAAALREVKTELPPARSPESWRGNAYYRHLDVLKGEQEICHASQLPDGTIKGRRS